jgi:hypothetical protein
MYDILNLLAINIKAIQYSSSRFVVVMAEGTSPMGLGLTLTPKPNPECDLDLSDEDDYSLAELMRRARRRQNQLPSGGLISLVDPAFQCDTKPYLLGQPGPPETFKRDSPLNALTDRGFVDPLTTNPWVSQRVHAPWLPRLANPLQYYYCRAHHFPSFVASVIQQKNLCHKALPVCSYSF